MSLALNDNQSPVLRPPTPTRSGSRSLLGESDSDTVAEQHLLLRHMGLMRLLRPLYYHQGTLSVSGGSGSINRTGAVPTFLRTPTVIQPHLDMKPFLQFQMETPPHSVGLFHNFNAGAQKRVNARVWENQVVWWDSQDPFRMSDTLAHTLPHTNTRSLTEDPMQLRDPGAAEDMKMDPVQKAVINHTFGVPLVKTKRPIISCNVCQIRFNSESQAEAHYKGNRHARRVKGIETSKSRPQESDKPPPGPVSSPSPTGPLSAVSDTEPNKTDDLYKALRGAQVQKKYSTDSHLLRKQRKQREICLETSNVERERELFPVKRGIWLPLTNSYPPAIQDLPPQQRLLNFKCHDETRPAPQLNGPAVVPGPLAISAPPTPESPGPSACPLLPTPTTPQPPPATSSSPGCGSSNPEQAGTGAPGAPSVTPSNPETEEDKAKKLLYCSLCKVAVNSLSQLEAHNKGTKHKTILEARSGLGPIKAYPRLGPKPSGEQGGGASDPNTQERTFHCEICNVRVNSELQLKQHISSRRHRDGVAGKPNPLLSRHKKHRAADLADLTKALGAGLLPSPLAVAAAMAAAASSNPLALRAAGPAPHPHHHLLQGPPLSHAILRPAPGPIRTSHGPILFSPY
ncbi:Zinc finger protein 385A [Anabarilius grahami]|uniref:Zinc finger protein 385A n=1 Tax=Anabarilius grahami TaxID=495550 RepID=A0A3N0YLA7_ANAGA|nr:Zinc finger protein 385A [Anabarilius grahami]